MRVALLDGEDHVLAAKYFVYNGRFCMSSIEAASQDRLAQYGDMSQDPGFGRESWVREFPHPPVM